MMRSQPAATMRDMADKIEELEREVERLKDVVKRQTEEFEQHLRGEAEIAAQLADARETLKKIGMMQAMGHQDPHWLARKCLERISE